MRHRSLLHGLPALALLVGTLAVGTLLGSPAASSAPVSSAAASSSPAPSAQPATVLSGAKSPAMSGERHAGASGRPLVRAAEALRGEGDATLALRDLFLARPRLGDVDAQYAGGLLARPTDGDSDPFGDGYAVASTKRCGAHVCVHSVGSTADAPPSPAWVRTTVQVMEKVWRHHVDKLGYRRPAPDARRGGNEKFDVYLKELGSAGLYGYCAPERRVPGRPRQASGFCVLDNDFARTQFGRPPMQTLRVTAGHEFFHAIQFAYDFAEDPWLLESTATWMEERFADDVNDNRAYLRSGQMTRPGLSLDLFEPSGLAHYGNWTFWEHLSDRFGPGIVREVWRRAGTGPGLPDDYSVQALRQVLSGRGGLRSVFATYAGANTVPSRFYPEGASFPQAPVVERRLNAVERRIAVTSRIDHLSSRSVRITPGAALKDPRWRLQLKIDAPDLSRSPAAHLIVQKTDGTLQQRLIRLNRTGFGMARIAFNARTTRSVTVTLANVSTRYRCDRGTTLACKGTAVDQRQGFRLKAFVER